MFSYREAPYQGPFFIFTESLLRFASQNNISIEGGELMTKKERTEIRKRQEDKLKAAVYAQIVQVVQNEQERNMAGALPN